eukprot:Hpha_TRINITY_DN1212_c0_g1::TRINITY_DN1212_c0_g1_i1::g.44785::m.44785
MGASVLLLIGALGDTGTFYVALNGSDTAAGTSWGEAFATVQKCVEVAPQGGTCYIGGGRYDREQDRAPLVISKDITLRGEPGALPVLDGSRGIETTWTVSSTNKCVYRSAPLGYTVWQLWAQTSVSTFIPSPSRELDGFSPLTPARFPNARLSDDSVFDSGMSRNGSMLYSSKTSTPGNLIDDGAHSPSIASSGIDFTGMIAVLPLGVMGSAVQGVKVLKHAKGSSSFTYKFPPSTREIHENNPYFFEGDCGLMDAEGEWCVDKSTGGLVVWLEGCKDPSTVAMRGKVRDYIFKTSRSKLNVKLSDIVLWGATFEISQTNIALDRVGMYHPQAHRYVLGEEGMTAAETWLNATSKYGKLTATNSTFEWGQTVVPFDRIGKGSFVSDCAFLRGQYALGQSASVGDGGSASELVFQHNTVRLFNSFSGIEPGLKSTVAYNEFAFQKPSVDGAGVHVHIKQQNGVLLYRNWAHDLVVKAFRFDRVNSPDATWGTNGTVINNVAWRTASACFKGDYHHIANNTVFDSSAEDNALFVMMYDPTKSWSIKGENAHTKLDWNAADSIFNVSGQLPGVHEGNVGNVRVRTMLKDPDNHDFRPIPGSLLDKNGAGAFTTPDSPVWTAGVRGAGGKSDVDCESATCSLWDEVRRGVR